MRIKKTSQYIEGGTGLPSYFTTEIDTGMKWIDGKTIYRKVIDFGALPNTASQKSVSIGVPNIDKMIDFKGIAHSVGFTAVIPNTNANSGSLLNIYYDRTGKTINIETYSDRSMYTETYITIEYTKN